MKRFYYSDRKTSKLLKLKDNKKGCWISITEPSQEDFAYIKQIADIKAETITEALDLFEVPRARKIRENVLIYLRTPDRIVNNQQDTPDSVLLIVNKDNIITVSASRDHFIDKFISKSKITTTTRTKFVFDFINELVEEYYENILYIHKKVQSMASDYGDLDSRDINALLQYEQTANLYESSLRPLQNMVSRLIDGKLLPVFAEDEEFLQLVNSEIIQALDIISVSLKLIISLRDSNQIIHTNTLNKNIQLLTGLTIVITIPTLISSLWGMNVDVPLNADPYAFWYIFSISIFISAMVFLILKLKKWI